LFSCFDDEVISLLDLGVERPREAMMLRAPETEALYEGSAQKGFGDPRVDGSPLTSLTTIGDPIIPIAIEAIKGFLTICITYKVHGYKCLERIGEHLYSVIVSSIPDAL
jgi:hypothetical protein